MSLLALAVIVIVVLGGISIIAYLRRIAAATERMADALERQHETDAGVTGLPAAAELPERS
jgi:hypothetical protein